MPQLRSRIGAGAAIVALAAAGALGGCGSGGSTPEPSARAPVIDPGDGGNYHPRIDPAGFVDVIDNLHLPFAVGARWRYEGTSDGEPETVEVTVTGERKLIMGVSTFVVRDTVTVAGELVEDTRDWFAQDRAGNVWYFGEDVQDYEHGKLVGTAGSWEAGVDGAQPGIVMPAAPEAGAAYRQEFYAGEAEDMMQILATGRSAAVRAGRFAGVVLTREWSPLEPDVVEEKEYAPGVGLVRERGVAGGHDVSELVEYTPGRGG